MKATVRSILVAWLSTTSLVSPEDAPPAERRVRVVEDVLIAYPAGEDDLVDLFIPGLLEWKRDHDRRIEIEAREILAAFSDPAKRQSLSRFLAWVFGQETIDPALEKAHRSTLDEAARLATAWKRWRSGFREVHLWSVDEAKAFFDEKKNTIIFHDLKYDDRANTVELSPAFLRGVRGVSDLPGEDDPVERFRLDIPLLYRLGTPVERVCAHCVETLGLVDRLAPQVARKAILKLHLDCLETSALRFLKSTLFPREEDTFLAEILARHVGFMAAHLVFKEEDYAELYKDYFSPVFPESVEDQKRFLAQLQDFDPLGDIGANSAFGEHLKQIRQGVLFSALNKVADRGTTVYRVLAESGQPRPEGGYTPRGFVAALSRTETGGESFEDFIRASADWYRKFVEAELKKAWDKTDGHTVASPTAGDGRRTRTFGELTITYPADLESTVEIVGPELVRERRRLSEELAERFETKALELPDDLIDSIRQLGFPVSGEPLGKVTAVVRGMLSFREFLPLVVQSKAIQIWRKNDLVEHLSRGGEAPGFTIDVESRKIDWGFTARLKNREYDALPAFPVLVPEEAEETSETEKANGITEYYGKEFPTLVEQGLQTFSEFLESKALFLATHELVELYLTTKVIASKDRRWFCDGLANYGALRICEKYLGEEEARELFDEMYPPDDREPLRGAADLLSWPAQEDVDAKRSPPVEHQDTYYYYATRVIEDAFRGRDQDFITRFLAEVRKTPYRRTNMETVYAAYKALAGDELLGVMRGTLAASGKGAARVPEAPPKDE